MTLQKLLKLSDHEMNNKFIEAEQRRIEAYSFEGDLQVEVKRDMGKWAKDTGVWTSMHYNQIVEAFAEDRGWTQEGFTGMEVVY